MYGAVEEQFYAFLMSALDGGERPKSHRPIFPGKEPPTPTAQEEQGWAVKRTPDIQPVISHYTPTLGDLSRDFPYFINFHTVQSYVAYTLLEHPVAGLTVSALLSCTWPTGRSGLDPPF